MHKGSFPTSIYKCAKCASYTNAQITVCSTQADITKVGIISTV